MGWTERAAKLDQIKLRMQDTLVNHKREVLMEHKVQSAVIHSDLAALSKKKEELSKRLVRINMVLASLLCQLHLTPLKRPLVKVSRP